MSDTPIWLDAFPHDFQVAQRTLRGLSKAKERGGAWLRITEPAPW